MSLDLAAILERLAHVYRDDRDDCDCDDCTACRAILEAHADDALLADEASADLAAYLDDRAASARDTLAHEADGSTRDDGTLYHRRLPSDDLDGFNPSITWLAPVRSVSPSQTVPPRSTILPPPSQTARYEAEYFTRTATVRPAPLPAGDRSPVCPCGAAREPLTRGTHRQMTHWLCAACGRVEYVTGASSRRSA